MPARALLTGRLGAAARALPPTESMAAPVSVKETAPVRPTPGWFACLFPKERWQQPELNGCWRSGRSAALSGPGAAEGRHLTACWDLNLSSAFQAVSPWLCWPSEPLAVPRLGFDL